MSVHKFKIGQFVFAVRAGRALIGDDMGLGKTIQCRDRNTGRAFRRLESTGDLSDLAQIPVAKRDHTFLGTTG